MLFVEIAAGNNSIDFLAYSERFGNLITNWHDGTREIAPNGAIWIASKAVADMFPLQNYLASVFLCSKMSRENSSQPVEWGAK